MDDLRGVTRRRAASYRAPVTGSAARWRWDVVLPVVLTLAAQVELHLPHSTDAAPPTAAHALLLVAVTAPLVLQRRAPLLAPAAATAAWAAEPLLFPVANTFAVPLCALGLAPLAAARWSRTTARAAVAVAVVLVLVALQGLVHEAYGIGDGVANTVFAGAVAVLGLVWRRNATERRRAEALAAERAAAADEARERGLRAVEAERARIARELHDVVGHGLSVVVLQARGARAVLAADPARAREALDEVERAASGALREMRLLTGLLRTTDDAAGPPPGPPDLPALVGDVRRAGVPVTLDADPLDGLPPGFAVTCYRVVQEALTNAARHAPGARVAVVVRRGEREVVVDVRNGAPPEPAPRGGDLPSTGGRGLAGVRERAAVLGGHVLTGPREDGGFRVLVRLPVPPPAAEGVPGAVREPARAAAGEAPA